MEVSYSYMPSSIMGSIKAFDYPLILRGVYLIIMVYSALLRTSPTAIITVE